MTEPFAPGDLRRRVLRSSRWTLFRTAALAVLQFATIAVLFRLFTVEDFAAISIVTVILTLTQVFSQTGIDLALVREKGDISPLYDSCWSVQVARGLVLGGLIAALAWPIAWWQNSPALFDYLLVSSLVPVIDGLRSISLMVFTRELEQRRPAIIDAAVAAVTLATLVLLAVWLRSPWAVVINQIVAVAVRSAAYFFAHPVRTRFTVKWSPLRRFVRFGIGFNFAQSSTYLIDTVDRLIIGRIFGAPALGLYDRSYALSHYGVKMLPGLLTASVVFPAFTRIKDDGARFWRMACRYLLGFSLLGTALAALVWWASVPILRVVVGPSFHEFLPFFQILLVLAVFRGISSLGQVLFYVLGRPQLQTGVNLVQVAILVVGLPIFAAGGELWRACVVAVVAGAVNTAMTVAILLRLAREARQVEAPAEAASVSERASAHAATSTGSR